MKRGRKPLKNEDDCEEWCFVCKDGGEMIICEHRDCLKSYHSECVNFDEAFEKSKGRFICGSHKCDVCKRSSDFQCYGCPKSVCGRCIEHADFVYVRQKKGFCDHCLKLSLLVEEKKDVDSDGEAVDFNNRDTYETLYKEYWEIINTAEKLTLEDLLTAKTKLKSGKNYESDKCDDSDEYRCSDSEEKDDIILLGSGKKPKSSKPKSGKKKGKSKVKSGVKSKSNKEEFIGWGSTRVMEFLTFIGKDMSIPLSQRELENIVKKYSVEKKLIQKNKIIECDEWLRSIFKRKTIRTNRIYDSLETHLAENQVSTSEDEDNEDEFGYDDFEEVDVEDKKLVVNKKKKKNNDDDDNDDKVVEKKEDVNDVSCFQFAAIVPVNIKLVYLRRSLVQKLAKEVESFESKVVGSFVRAKEDANAFFSKGSSYKLMQITGVKKCLADEDDFILQAVETDFIRITSLSDDDFSEEECQDLKKKVKSGLLQRLELTVVEEKARSLHRDITTHWIPRELGILKHRIDQANEKGWRKELFEYLKKREFLLDETNKQKLLEKVPSVVPDVEDDTKDSPISILTSSLPSAFGINSAMKPEVPASETYEMAMKLEKFFGSLEKSRKPSVVRCPSQLFDSVKETSTIDDITMVDVEDTESFEWFIVGPVGDTVGPVSLSILKNWGQADVASRTRIYKVTETKERAKPLAAVLQLAFSRKC